MSMKDNKMQDLTIKIKAECIACETPIHTKSGRKWKKGPEYNERRVNLNDGSQMTIGVCKQHLTQPLELNSITKKAHEGWLEEIKLGIGNTEWIQKIGLKLKITGVAQ